MTVSEEDVRGRQIMGKVVVSEEGGRKFGTIEDLSFITESGELMNMILADPTKYAVDMSLQSDERGRFLIPFSSVTSIGDFVIVAEKDII